MTLRFFKETGRMRSITELIIERHRAIAHAMKIAELSGKYIYEK